MTPLTGPAAESLASSLVPRHFLQPNNFAEYAPFYAAGNKRALPDRMKSDYDFVMAVRLGLCALVVLVTLNDSACDAFLRDHGKQIFRGFAALFLSGTFSYLMYRLATCFVRDSASRRRNRDRLRAEIQKSGLLLLAGCLKMVVILEPRLEHHIAWLSWLSLAFAVLGFLVRWRGPKRRLTLRDRRSAVAAND